MALNKTSFYLGLILIFVIVSVGLANFGNDLNKTHNLDNKSKIYIGNFTSYIDGANFDDFSEADTDTLKDEKYLSQDNTTGEPDSTSFLATLNFYKSRVQKPLNYILFVYNIPTFVLNTYGLDLGAFGYVINTLVVVLFIGTLFFIINKLRGA